MGYKETLAKTEQNSKGGAAVLIWTAVGVAGLFLWTMISLVREQGGVPFWAIAVIIVFTVVMCLLTVGAILQGRETGHNARLAAALASDPLARPVQGRVVELVRIATAETREALSTRVRLTIAAQMPDGEREVQLLLMIEDPLLPQFMAGKTVHLLYDPADPSVVALDPVRSPIKVGA